MSSVEKTITQDIEMPARFGRYRVRERLGSGILGVVYKAWDEDLRRNVAVKVPHARWLLTPRHVEIYLAQSRQIAALDSPGFVPLYDAGQADEGHCYLVMKLVDEGSLADRVGRERISAARAVRLVADAARALHQAHRQGLIHRNIKPANILLDEGNHPCLTDFGMPLVDASVDFDAPPDTVQWLSPEQLLGESHRIDARTDVYSLGLVLYALLAGKSPFAGVSARERTAQARLVNPPALGEIVTGFPVELIRSCHKALSRPLADRYSTALDFAEDLEACLPLLSASSDSLPVRSAAPTAAGAVSPATPTPTHAERPPSTVSTVGETTAVRVVPRGLRSFDREDADFFLELLPGPRGRDGLPDILRHWKARLEETDPDRTFPVGLLYGPSGCGKSSLVKAGLLPRLDDRIIRVYLEATPEGTEARLLATLRRRCPWVAPDQPLDATLAEIRLGRHLVPGAKVVILLDQFEQWLHANRDVERPELAQALRQCDGRRLQCVVMVRDDFWMAVTRFMQELEVRLVEGQNSAAVDLFTPQHARKVLIAFGRAYGCLPQSEKQFGPAEHEFLREAINGLTTDGKVVSVQLSLFADMIKHKPWVPATLKEVGGTAGIGVAFLEETFSGPHAPPQHRRHQRAARGVLKQLLPEQGTNIKGRMHSREQLLAASGYAAQPREFDELLQLLDQELRLITPADPEGQDAAGDVESDPEVQNPKSEIPNSYYQLTHDFLVLSIRRWLVRKQQETRRGRAELLLADRADNWTARPERRYLPSWWQWLRIRGLTSRADWNAGERSMMRSADRHHALRGALVAIILTLAGWSGYEGLQYVRAQSLRDQLLYASTAETPDVVAELAPYRRWMTPLLTKIVEQSPADSRESLHARLGLLANDSSQVGPLFERALTIDDATLPVVIRALAGHRAGLVERLWTMLADDGASPERRLRAALFLAEYDPPADAASTTRWQSGQAALAARLHAAVVADPARFNGLAAALRPISSLLIDPLRERARDKSAADSDRAIASNVLLEFAAARADVLAEILRDGGSPDRQAAIIDKLMPLREQAVSLLEPELARSSAELTPAWKDAPREKTATVDAAVTGKIISAAGLVSERFAFCQTLPMAELADVARGLEAAGYRPTRVRPYRQGDEVRVAAVWARDGRGGRFESALTEGELRRQLEGDVMKTDLLIDLAIYEEREGEVRHAVVWSPRREGDPEVRFILGSEKKAGEWAQFRDERAKDGFTPVSLDVFPLPAAGRYYAGVVFWKSAGTSARELRPAVLYERELAGDLAGQLQTTVDLTAVPTASAAEERRAFRLAEIEDQDRILAGNPASMAAWFHRGSCHFYLGHDEEAIRDFTHYIDGGGETSEFNWRLHNSHHYRAVAAARMGRKELSEKFLEQAAAAVPDDEHARRLWRALAHATVDPEHTVPAEFERASEPEFSNAWAFRNVAWVYAWGALQAAQTDPQRARQFTDKAVECLARAMKAGDYANWLLNEVWFAAIVDDPRIQRLHLDLELLARAPIRLARQGNEQQARAELAQFLQNSTDLADKMRVEAATLAYLGEDELAARKIEATIADKPDDDYPRFWGAAHAYGLIVHAVKEKHPDRARAPSDRALELIHERLPRLADQGQVSFRRELRSLPMLLPLRELPRYRENVAALDRQYTFVTRSESELESQELHGLDPQQHLDRARQLAAQGWQLVALDACALPGTEQPATASVWHRPRVSEKEREQFASGQAASAVALVRLGRPDPVWPLLKQTPDPRLRTAIGQLLTPAGTAPRELASRLEREADSAIRRTLVVALGESGLDQLPAAERDNLVDQLESLFRKDRDPGVHSAAEWSLRKWGQAARLTTAKRALATEPAEDDRAWTVTPHGHTLVRVAGPIETTLGSPPSEPTRELDEQLHRRRIPRSYQIAASEVTVRQFDEFVTAHPEVAYQTNRTASPQPECPANNATWFHAAQYCRWLSEQEGLPEEEMVYPPVSEIGPGMRLSPYAISRAGYRLPTEAEWEHACRAGTGTSRYFGQSENLLSRYAWYKSNAAEHAWPVGLLRPNDLGLFDLYGNVCEMCAEHLSYPRPAERFETDDGATTQRLPVKLSLRGGSYVHEANWMRSADRYEYGDYQMRAGHVGFRVARTVPSADVTAARALRRQAREQSLKGNAKEVLALNEQAVAAFERVLAARPDSHDVAWELSDLLLDAAAGWVVLEPKEAVSEAGATLKEQKDQSLLVSGKLPETDTYAVEAEVSQSDIAGLRLEALTHPTLPKGGPGRSETGTFTVVLQNFELAGGSAPAVTLTKTFATGKWYGGNGPGAGIGTAPDGGRDHVVVWEADRPRLTQARARIKITLRQDYPKHALGRFRLSVTAVPHAGKFEEWRYHLGQSSLNGWARLACAHAALNHPEAALAALARVGRNATGGEPRDLFLMSHAHRLLGQVDEARLWLDRGLAKWDEKTADLALKRLVADALAVITDNTSSHLTRRALLLYESDEVGAANLFERLFDEHGADPAILLVRAHMYAEMGKHELADADFRRAADLSRDQLDRFLETDWWAIGTYPGGLSVVHPPENDPDPSRPPAVAEGVKALRWQRVGVQAPGRINLVGSLKSDNVSDYLMTYVYSPVERTATFVIGADDQARVWLNGDFVHEVPSYKPFDLLGFDRVPVTLRAGKNTLLVKVRNGIGEFVLQMRLADNPLDEGLALARLGLWEKAASLLRRASADFGPGTLSVPNETMLARVFLAAGNLEDYREVCRRVFQFLSGNNTPAAAENMAFLAGLGDGAGLTRERMTELADLAGTIPAREFWRFYNEALAHYRAGNFERALQILDGNAQLGTLEKVHCLRALALFRSGRTEEARRALATAGERYAAYEREVLSAGEFRVAPLLWWELAELRILYREARQVVDGVKSGSDPTTQALTARALGFWENRDPATRDFDDAVRDFPALASSWKARARRFQQLNQPGKAAADYLKALSLAPDDAPTRLEFEQVLSSLGDPGEALTHLLEASGLKPVQPRYWLERGRLWRGLDKPDLAAADFARALDLFPPATDWDTSNWGAPRARAEYEIAGDQDVLERLLAMRPDDGHLRITAARRHATFNRWKQAIKGYAPLVRQLGPGDEWTEYAALLWLTGDRAGYDEFLEWTAARLNPEAGWYDGYVMTRAAIASETRSIAPERLIAAMEIGVKTDPPPWLLHVSGLALLRGGRIAEAVGRFNESRRDIRRWAPQNHAQNELGLALAAASQGDFTEAARWYEQAVAHIGTSAGDVWPQDWIGLAVLRRLAQEKIVGHAIDQVTEQLSREPKNLEVLLSRRAALHARVHHWPAAAADYRRLWELNAQDDALCRQEAQMHVQQQHWASAAQAMRRALNLKPDLELHLCSMQFLTLLAYGDDPAAYHRTCGELLALVGDTGDCFVAERVAKGSLLLSPLPDNLDAVVRLANRAVTLDPKSGVIPWAQATRALAAYRHGDDDDALAWAERCLTADLASPTWYRAAQAHLVVAMTRQRMGEREAARAALARAAALIQPMTDRYEAAGEVDSGYWHDWLISTLLLREAQSLIE